jgi:hypothetical protein
MSKTLYEAALADVRQIRAVVIEILTFDIRKKEILI